MSLLKISQTIEKRIRCPRCKSKLTIVDERLICSNTEADHSFPIVDGVPILLNEESSIFSIQNVVENRLRTKPSRDKLRSGLMTLIPSIGKKIKSKDNIRVVAKLLHEQDSRQVLILGGGEIGEGMEALYSDLSIDLVDTDVSIGTHTGLVCDAHMIPFDDGSFDAVIAQALLEHVIDPFCCVKEIDRVLKDHGLVYIETPFVLPVHGGKYDFMRFTQLGLRRLLKRFDEISSGATGGPGMALAWSYRYFLMSMTDSKPLRAFLWAWSGLTSFYLKYFDFWLMRNKGSLDAAAVYYFLGRKEGNALQDQDLIRLYRGAQS